MFSLDKRRLHKDSTKFGHPVLEWKTNFTTPADSTRIRRNGVKLEGERFRFYVREKSFPQRVLKHWDRLPREFVDAHPGKCSGPGWMGP